MLIVCFLSPLLPRHYLKTAVASPPPFLSPSYPSLPSPLVLLCSTIATHLLMPAP